MGVKATLEETLYAFCKISLTCEIWSNIAYQSKNNCAIMRFGNSIELGE